ncbi:hypothetical protein ACKFKG_10335 [Phormidesmis sp. 146-35]
MTTSDIDPLRVTRRDRNIAAKNWIKLGFYIPSILFNSYCSSTIPILLGIQFCSIHLKTLLHLEVVHPLVGFMLFYVSSTLVHEVGRGLSCSHDQPQQQA